MLSKNKPKSKKGSEYKRSEMQTPSQGRNGSYDRLKDFKGLNDEDDDRSFKNYDYTNDINIRNLREDLRVKEGSLKGQLSAMREYKDQQKQEIQRTYDSLLQLQVDLEQKYKNRKTQNNDFYNTLAAENKTLLSSLRNNKRSSLNPAQNFSKSYGTSGSRLSMTPYEQRYGLNNSQNYYPPMHHESVFLNTEAPQFNPHQNTNDVLDDLLHAYQGANTMLGMNGGGGRFVLPVPKTSMRNLDENYGQPYNDNVIKVDENINIEDSLDRFVGDAEIEQSLQQEVA